MQLIRRSDYLWEIPQTGAMRVPGRIYANARMIDEMRNDPCLTQVANVACLPGIVGYSLAMPDIHWGYGFPIGGVAAVDAEHGVISLGGADPERISQRAYKRGSKQLGTLGSGNHFLEVSRIDRIFDAKLADALDLHLGQVTLLIHSGSRGLGHQTCDDYLKIIVGAMGRYEVSLPDRQLAAVPINSPEGKAYFGAMAGAANFAWCNRQLMMHLAEQAFLEALSIAPRDLGFAL